MAKIHSFVVVQNKRHDVKVMFAEALNSHKAMTNNKTAVLWMLGMHWQTGAHDESRYLDKCQLHAKPLIKQGIVVFFASCMHASCCLLLMQNASFFYLLCLHRQLGRLAMCSCAVVQLCSCAHKQSLCRHICTLGTTLDQQPKWDIQTIVDPLNENCVWRICSMHKWNRANDGVLLFSTVQRKCICNNHFVEFVVGFWFFKFIKCTMHMHILSVAVCSCVVAIWLRFRLKSLTNYP